MKKPVELTSDKLPKMKKPVELPNKVENTDKLTKKKSVENTNKVELPNKVENTDKSINDLGQYFTTNNMLKSKVYEFILNNSTEILEPSIGQGDLVDYISSKMANISFDMYEIDTTIKLLSSIKKESVIYGDFLVAQIDKKYDTIVGNPPYVRTKNGNLYIDFIQKCYNLLNENGELIFIIPSDFLKLTSASHLINLMMLNGNFTHIFHPNDEKLFKNASIDVIIFRYCKTTDVRLLFKTLYNDKSMNINNKNGLITFTEVNSTKLTKCFSDYFDIYVGVVSGKDSVYKNESCGNISVLNANNVVEKYIYVEKFPSKIVPIDEILTKSKSILLSRKIRNFNETNWFEWGAMRNKSAIIENSGKNCIYISTLSRKKKVAFCNVVQYFGGGLIMLLPKPLFDSCQNQAKPLFDSCQNQAKPLYVNLQKITNYLNTNEFKNNFTFANRFKIGHRAISNSYFPDDCLDN